jgi:integrase
MSSRSAGTSFFAARSPTSSASMPQHLVFDGAGVLHRPLTSFARFAQQRLAQESVRSYLSALCRYFTWLQQAGERGRPWNRTSAQVRADVMEYLVAALGCQVREHRLGFMTVRLTSGQRSVVSGFLSALRLFYASMAAGKLYRGANPLARHLALQDAPEKQVGLTEETRHPRMPVVSGCEADGRLRQPRNDSARLTDCYFVIVNERWTPQPIDDPGFPARIFAAGERTQWRLREVLVTRLLFETGARVHEVCALTLGDWFSRGLKQEATCINKGSGRRRVKFVRWSPQTTKLLLRYFDGERRSADPDGFTLNDHVAKAKSNSQSLFDIPLFLTARERGLSAKTFRDLYWRPACLAAGLDADIHQTRHWYVTMAIRAIYSSDPDDLSRERRTEELIRYMAWRGGKVTLKAYEHYFTAIRHADIQAQLHRRLDRVLRHPPKRSIASTRPSDPKPIVDAEWDFLRRLGGGH